VSWSRRGVVAMCPGRPRDGQWRKEAALEPAPARPVGENDGREAAAWERTAGGSRWERTTEEAARRGLGRRAQEEHGGRERKMGE
jgi:hypothetical protein